MRVLVIAEYYPRAVGPDPGGVGPSPDARHRGRGRAGPGARPAPAAAAAVGRAPARPRRCPPGAAPAARPPGWTASPSTTCAICRRPGPGAMPAGAPGPPRGWRGRCAGSAPRLPSTSSMPTTPSPPGTRCAGPPPASRWSSRSTAATSSGPHAGAAERARHARPRAARPGQQRRDRPPLRGARRDPHPGRPSRHRSADRSVRAAARADARLGRQPDRAKAPCRRDRGAGAAGPRVARPALRHRRRRVPSARPCARSPAPAGSPRRCRSARPPAPAEARRRRRARRACS